MADYLNIAGRVRTTASDGVAMEAQEVKDLNQNKSQQEINADVQTELGDRYTKEETYNREEIEELVDPTNYVSVVATNATTAVTDILPATGEANTIYRVGNWNGTQYDPTMYALYAWNGTTYVCLAVRSFAGEVYDVSVNHPDGQGNPTPYADLAAALGTSGANIPADIRRGGMSIKFIQGNAQSSDNKYVQYLYHGTSNTVADFTNVANWEKTNLEDEVSQLGQEITNYVQILFNTPEEINNAFIAYGKYIQAVQGQQYPAKIKENPAWKLLSIPIVQGVEYVFHYNLWAECSFYVTNNDYTPTPTIVYGRYNGNTISLTNVVIIDNEKKLASFTSPVNGLFNINFDLRPSYGRLDFVFFRKKSDTSVANVIGIPENINDSIDSINNSFDSINNSIDSINDSIDSITIGTRTQDVELYIPSTINNWEAAPFPSFVGGVGKNSKNPAGKLVALKTIKSIPAGNRRIRVYRKNRDSDDIIVSLTTLATYNITSSNDWMELDVSALNIQLIEDVAIGLEVNNNTELGFTGVVPTTNQEQILFNQSSNATEASLLSLYNNRCGGMTFVVETKVLTIEDSPEYLQLKQQVDTIENAVATTWSSLNVVMLGDSITELGGTNCDDSDGWTKWFKDRANPLTCKSYAKSGAKMSNQSTTEYDITTNPAQKDNVFYNQINRLINDCNNGQVAPDVIFIAFGTNDSRSPLTPAASSVFTQNTSAYTTTEPVTTMLSIAQSIRYGVEMLYSQFPNVQIMFLSPQQTTWFSIFSVGDEIENSCRYLGIPCLRLDYEAATWSIRERVAYYKTYDGTHTSEIGAKRNGYFIERWASTKLQW